jgi:hypothetical protein
MFARGSWCQLLFLDGLEHRELDPHLTVIAFGLLDSATYR